MTLTVRRDETSMNHTDVSKVGEVCHLSFMMLQKNASLVDTMKVLVIYFGAFKLEYGLRFVNESIKYNVNDTMSSEYLPLRAHKNHTLFIQFAKWCLKKEEVLLVLSKLWAHVGSGNNLASPMSTAEFCTVQRAVKRS